MNNLSLLLYFSDVAYTFTLLAWSALFWGWIVFFIIRLILWISSEEYPRASPTTKARKQRWEDGPWFPSPKWVWFSSALLVFLLLIPSEETFYLIVASEAGEAAATTPEGKEMLADLKGILDVQLEKLKQ